MKIFSSFDTNIKKERGKYYASIYGKDNIMILEKSRLFLLVYVTVPLTTLLIIILGLGYLVYNISQQNIQITLGVMIPAIIIFFSRGFNDVLKNIIDYKMDFCIITPHAVEKYNQTGIVQRDINDLASEKIKSVKTNKKGLLYSIFNNGDLIFMSEGDTAEGEIVMDYVKSPDQKKKRIMNIINTHLDTHKQYE